jgi:hypothetical protein
MRVLEPEKPKTFAIPIADRAWRAFQLDDLIGGRITKTAGSENPLLSRGLSYRRRKAPKPTSSKAIPRAMQKRPHVMWFGMTVAPIPPKKNTMAAII